MSKHYEDKSSLAYKRTLHLHLLARFLSAQAIRKLCKLGETPDTFPVKTRDMIFVGGIF